MRKPLVAGAMAAAPVTSVALATSVALITGLALVTATSIDADAASRSDSGRNAVYGHHGSARGSRAGVRARGPLNIHDSRLAGHGSHGGTSAQSDPGLLGPGITFGTGDYGCSPTDKAHIGGFCGDYVPY